ncbi:cysteine-rich VLP protein [Mesobacillus jeotgali]|uniref:cysteine-rich VLP protein n=1 Tax=Mesobacillus jeotgali TaxID=129985 RepID=UPI000C84C535|nr:cysteine-rich VLP protein [Mesobacillus jeotgali]
MSVLKACSKLAENNCASFINGKCLGDISCPVFNQVICEGLRCPYFETAVLPADKNLQESYSVEVLKATARHSSKKCKGCGNTFKTDNYRIQYCGDRCRNHGKKKANRIADSKYRQNEKSALIKA